MTKINTPYVIVLVSLVVLSFYPIAKPTSFNIHQEISPAFVNFPKTLGDWVGEDSKTDERVYEILETRNVLSRTYKNPSGQSIHLLLVGSQQDRRVAHPPEVCYLGSNYNISNTSESQVQINGKLIPIKYFSAQHERNLGDKQKVAYFYKIDSRFTINYYAQQLQFALDQLSKKNSQVLLIRLAGSDETIFPDFLTHLLTALN